VNVRDDRVADGGLPSGGGRLLFVDAV
jgi:hypothetical protein